MEARINDYRIADSAARNGESLAGKMQGGEWTPEKPVHLREGNLRVFRQTR